MAGPLAKYAFINAKLRARISNILPDETFGQLEKAVSIDAALTLLRDTAFAALETVYSATGDLRQAELELLKKEIDLYKDIRQHVHPDSLELIEALLYQFETDNLKNAIRIFFDRQVRKRPADAGEHYIIYERIVHDIPFDIIVNARSFDEVAAACEGTPYRGLIRKFAPTVEADTSLFRMEVALDHLYYERLLAAIAKLDRKDREIAMRLAGVEIDLQNINWILRLKAFYDMPLEAVLATIVPGGLNLNKAVIHELYQAQNVTSVLHDVVTTQYPGLSAMLSARASDLASRLLLIRRILDEILKQEIRRILSGYPFTIGTVLAYFALKRNELKRIRTILNAKQYGIEPERIESMF
ncbi:MAG TPA: hypothetical protein ENN81_01035 [Phycisphaerales bacterium]|nr:hypothetical protein [Phycisphaerales bacterium]